MRTAGIREARQNLSGLLEEVRAGHEVLITDRGKPVARLVPPRRESALGYVSRRAFRETMPTLSPPLSMSLTAERDDRL
jgi:prevent-host-death family protein